MEKCNLCNKLFSKKSNLRKHVKSVHEKIKFKCEICNKELSRKGDLRRHKLSVHSKSIELKCTVCEKKFSRKDYLLAHKNVCCKCRHCHEQFSSPSELLNHICPEKKTSESAAKRFKSDEPAIQTSFVPLSSNQVQNPEQSIPESTSVIPSNSKPRKSLKIKRPNKKSTEQNNEPIQNPELALPTTCPRNLISIEATPAALEVLPCEPQNPTKTKPSNSKRKQKEQETEETLQEQNPEIRDFLLKHWSSIRSYTRLGPVQDIFNFYYDRMFRDLVDKILTKIIQKQKHRFKINYSFGFVLRNIETQSYRYYHSSHNNAQVLDRAVLISNRHDLVNFLNALSEEDFWKTLTRPDTKWQIVDITNVTFYVTKLKDMALGAPIDLPDNVKFNTGLVNFSAEDHLFFYFFIFFFIFCCRNICIIDNGASRRRTRNARLRARRADHSTTSMCLFFSMSGRL